MARMAIDDPLRIRRQTQIRHLTTGFKVGATSGFVVNAATDVGRAATCPASQTAATLVCNIPFMKKGWAINAFHAIGQIESAGNGVTVDLALKKITAAAADLTVSSALASITQLSVTADTIMSHVNTRKALSEPAILGATETFFLLLTATTGASTDIDLMALAVEFIEI